MTRHRTILLSLIIVLLGAGAVIAWKVTASSYSGTAIPSFGVTGSTPAKAGKFSLSTPGGDPSARAEIRSEQVVVNGDRPSSITIDGEEFRVVWRGDTREIQFPTGEKYSQVAFVQGKMHGVQQIYFRSGALCNEGPWEMGKRAGLWHSYFENGLMSSQGHYEQDLRNGLWETWYESGQIRSLGEYMKQRRQGEWMYWNPDGSLNSTQSGWYSDDKKARE